ncbi:MAG: cyclodeaminase/cyclohydrolase family protein [bacterium]
MKYIDEPLIKYIEDASSGNPTPGGGSIAGMTGALAASMCNMVCNFTIGKKAYLNVEEKVRSIFEQSTALMKELLNLTVEDTEVYSLVSEAYCLPKNTDEEKKVRGARIQDACKKALSVPEKIMEKAYTLLTLLEELVDKGNKNLITDTGVSALLSAAAIDAAVLNIKINLKFINDQDFVQSKEKRIAEIKEDYLTKRDIIMNKVNQLIEK